MSDKNLIRCTALAAVLILGAGATAAAAADNGGSYQARLDAGEITPLGGKRAGNADGTIPAWKCDDDGTPPGIDVPASASGADSYPAMDNPFADEKPRFVITARNYQQYEDRLSDGTVKLLKTYPDDFRIPVYPTHRTACYTKFSYEQTALNAKNGKLIDAGNGVANMFMGLPFPVPQSGIEAMWDNAIGPNPFYEKAHYTGIAKFAGGRNELNETDYLISSMYNDPAIGREDYLARNKQIQSGYYNETIKPERQRGTTVIGATYLRQTVNRRQTWQYLPGTRRVRRFPYFGYDTPQGVGGLRGIDEDRLFNGAFDRYDWKLLGTREMIVPYNAYVWDSAPSYDALLGDHVANPEYTRWELHRVRVVQGTLKPGAQHWYKKRVLYIDEDTGHALLSDNYDHHDNLWRTGQQNYVWTPVLKDGVLARAAMYYDFEARAFAAQRLINENQPSHNPKINNEHLTADYYSPGTLRRNSVR